MTVASSRRVRVLLVVLVLQVVAATSVAVARQPHGSAVAAQVQARALSHQLADRPADRLPDRRAERAADVQALLDVRARAVLTRDRAVFLAGIDPQATSFAARQAALFDALAEVPLSGWAYTLDTDQAQPPDAALDARYGAWWAPRVVLGVGLEGIDSDPAESTQALTFVQRDSHWYLAADDDFVARGASTARELWDGGPVSVVRGARSLVLGHPGALPQLRRLASDVDAAVPRVTAVWGTGWSQRVAVVMPADQAELGRLVTARGSLSPIAALAVSGPVRGGSARGGDRVLINPPNLALLGAVGRRVVLTHEITHVAARSATGRATPSWLSEGLADHVGFLGTAVPVSQVAAELRTEVRAGRVPAQLPADSSFSGDDPALSSAYQQAWLAVELLVKTYGQPRVLALYRDLGARSGQDAQREVEQSLQEQLGTGVADFTAAWQSALRRQLA